MSNEQHPTDYLAELALGVLPEAEAAAVRVHIGGCQACRDEFEEMVRVAAVLPLAADEMEPSPSVKEAVFERVRLESRPIALPRRGASRRWFALAAAVAALAIIAVAAGAGYLAGANGGGNGGTNNAYAEAAARGTLQTASGSAGQARAVVVRVPGYAEAFAWVEGLPALPPGKAYQAWFIGDGGAEPAEVFASAEGGVRLTAARAVDRYTAIGLTIEDRAGAQTPSAAPFITVPLNRSARLP